MKWERPVYSLPHLPESLSDRHIPLANGVVTFGLKIALKSETRRYNAVLIPVYIVCIWKRIFSDIQQNIQQCFNDIHITKFQLF